MPDTVHCIIVDDERVAREILQSHLGRIKSVNLVASCKNAIEAFNIINEVRVDLIFLDINMPEISGLSFARSINSDIKVIFTTAYREYAVDGFDLKAVDYLLKPISFERLLQAVDKYLGERRPVKNSTIPASGDDSTSHIFVRSDRKMVKICFEEILFIESIGDYIRINLQDKSVVTRETIADIELMLPDDKFIRTHRSFIVSLDKIDSFTSEYIDINNKQIPVSRSYKDHILKILGT